MDENGANAKMLRLLDTEVLIPAVAPWRSRERSRTGINQPPDEQSLLEVWLDEDSIRRYASSAWYGAQEVRRLDYTWRIMIQGAIKILNDMSRVCPFQILPLDTLQLVGNEEDDVAGSEGEEPGNGAGDIVGR